MFDELKKYTELMKRELHGLEPSIHFWWHEGVVTADLSVVVSGRPYHKSVRMHHTEARSALGDLFELRLWEACHALLESYQPG